jgi:hypothetical protein
LDTLKGPAMSEEWTREEVQHAVESLVDELLKRAGVSEPPVDALALARTHLGIPVRVEAGGGRRRGRQEIVLPEDAGPEQQQWLAAQAIGQHLCPAALERVGMDQAGGLSSASLVNLLARQVLVPAGWLAGEARSCGYDLEELHRRYRTVSMETLAWRLLDLPEPCVITVVDNEHVQARRSNAWRVGRTLSPTEEQCQRYVHKFSRPRVVSAGGWTVLGWPLHQPDWKRELLRSVIEEDAVGE